MTQPVYTDKVTIHRDDRRIMDLAKLDGCAGALIEARFRAVGTTIITDRRLYRVETTPGDSGLLCFEVASPIDMPVLLVQLAPLIGPIDKAWVADRDAGSRN